jgi:aspartate aminotransferase
LTASLEANAPIGIFDSGLGGLAVLREVRRWLPHENVLFLGDTARQPYGPQPIENVRRYAVEITAYLAQQGVKMVIIACNTASAAGQEAAQRRFPELPVLGMIGPGVRAALTASQHSRIGVWGTGITVKSKAYDQRILHADPTMEVLGVACPDLLRLAEKGRIDDRPHLVALARRYFQPLADFEIDTLILGCTDLTCVRDIAEEVAGQDVLVIDPAEEVVREARQILEGAGRLKPPTGDPPRYQFLITGDDLASFAAFTARFMGLSAVEVEQIALAQVQQAITAADMVYTIAPKVANLELSATDEIDNIVRRMQRSGINDIISLGGGEPCFDTPQNIKEAAYKALVAGKTKYEPTTGDPDLRVEISRKLKRENRIDTGPEDIIVTPGGKFAVFLAFQAVLEPGDRVMLLEPAWVSYKSMAQLAGADVVSVECAAADGFLPDLDAIQALMDRSVRFIVVSSPCNPTGAVYDRSTLRGIAEIAQPYGALVLSDEVYEYLLYEGEQYSPASEYENVVTVNGFSKSYAMTGWRLGYVTAPKAVLEGMIKIYQHSATCVTAFAQAGAVEALSSEESQRASRQMMVGYRERRDLMLELLNRSELFDCVTPHGAFYCFPSYSLDMPSLQFATQLLEEAHVATVPGSAFGACGEGYLRLCYSNSKENLVEAFERMESFVRKHR